MKNLTHNKIKENAKQKNNVKTEKGITLIALVITIVILLILAAVAIGTLTGENGLIKRAQDAKNKTLEAGNLENATFGDLENLIDSSTGTTNGGTSGGGTTGGGSGNTGGSTGGTGSSTSDIFDETGNVDGKLHVGDFVNYTAGTWTEADMNKITASGAKIAANKSATSLPSTSYQFGGFAQGASKDGNATPYNSSYNYVKDENGNAITGWRVFDIEADGTVTLITAGCPEDYYHPDVTNGAYISEYILTGNQPNSSVNYSTYTSRDWTMYQNSKYGATNAKVLTKAKLDSWYTKYMTAGTTANTGTISTFQKIYGTKYESLIDNYSYYGLYSANGSIDVPYVDPNNRRVISGSDYAFGVRVLVSLPSDIKWTRNGTKTVNSRNVNYNYNVWNIQ